MPWGWPTSISFDEPADILKEDCGDDFFTDVGLFRLAITRTCGRNRRWVLEDLQTTALKRWIEVEIKEITRFLFLCGWRKGITIETYLRKRIARSVIDVFESDGMNRLDSADGDLADRDSPLVASSTSATGGASQQWLLLRVHPTFDNLLTRPFDLGFRARSQYNITPGTRHWLAHTAPGNP
jgi:hypothetical protein